MNERGRHRIAIHRDGADELICPKPRRVAFGFSSAAEMLKTGQKLQSRVSLAMESDAGCEILDILLCKNGQEDVGGPSSAMPHFAGSPPNRSSNPLIHDVQFNQKKLPYPAIFSEQRSPHSSHGAHPSVKKGSCSSSYGASPSVRVEGFTSSSSDSHRGVPTLA